MDETLYELLQRIADSIEDNVDKFVVSQIAKRFKALGWYDIDHISYKKVSSSGNIKTQAEELFYNNLAEFSYLMRLDSIIINSMIEFAKKLTTGESK